MKNIIEKLDIKPGPWYAEDLIVRKKLSNMSSIETKQNKYRSYYPVVAWDTEKGLDIHTSELNLILASPDMLEALICQKALDMPVEKGYKILELFGWSKDDRFELSASKFVERKIDDALFKASDKLKDLLK